MAPLFQRRQRPRLAGFHQPRIANHAGNGNGGEAAGGADFTHVPGIVLERWPQVYARRVRGGPLPGPIPKRLQSTRRLLPSSRAKLTNSNR